MSKSSKKSSASPEELKDILERIDELDDHMRNEILIKLMTYSRSDSNKNLMMVNKNLANIHSYTVKLTKIKPASPKLSPKSLTKQIDKVIETVGNLKIKDLEKFSPINEKLKKIFDKTKLINILTLIKQLMDLMRNMKIIHMKQILTLSSNNGKIIGIFLIVQTT